MRPDRTWIVIADGAHASVVQCVPGDAQLIDVDDMHLAAELPPSRELVADRPGRSFESQGRTRHAKEGRSDPHRELKRSFAKSIANRLKAKLDQKRYEHLILIAPPVTLGDLRSALHRQLRDRVRAELPQDLVELPPRKLRRHLRAVMPAKRRTSRRSASGSPRQPSSKP